MNLMVDALEVWRLPGTHLLGAIDLCINKGERWALVGESGSGKSLLAQALFGVLPPGVVQTAGSLRAFGVPLGPAAPEGLPGRPPRLGTPGAPPGPEPPPHPGGAPGPAARRPPERGSRASPGPPPAPAGRPGAAPGAGLPGAIPPPGQWGRAPADLSGPGPLLRSRAAGAWTSPPQPWAPRPSGLRRAGARPTAGAGPGLPLDHPRPGPGRPGSGLPAGTPWRAPGGGGSHGAPAPVPPAPLHRPPGAGCPQPVLP